MTERRLTEDEKAEFKDAFGIYDPENTGYVHDREIAHIMNSLGVFPTESEIHNMVLELDPEKIGSFTIDSFLTLMARKLTDDYPEEILKTAFKVLDKDSNGLISVADVRGLVYYFGLHLDDDDIDAMVREVDMDGDGQINYEEFYYLMSRGGGD